MVNTTLENLLMLKRIGDMTSTYRRDKFLNDWVVSCRSRAFYSRFTSHY